MSESKHPILRGHHTLLIYTAVVAPVVAIMLIGYNQLHTTLTQDALLHHSDVASTAANVLEERFHRVRDLSVSLAGRVRFRELVVQQRWSEAVAIFGEDVERFPYIERIFLADTNGVLRSDIPHRPGVTGVDFSFRDWYEGVSEHWEPYVSKIYRRTAEPRYNVVTVAVPIRKDSAVVGILAMQMNASRFLQWSQEFAEGGRRIYIVDHMGQLAAHPQFDPQQDIRDYSAEEPVQRILRGQKGSEVFSGTQEGREVVAGFAPVGAYGWGVVAYESAQYAFLGRSGKLQSLLLQYMVFFAIAVFAASWLSLLSWQRKKALDKAEESYRCMRDIADNTSAIVYIKDVKGRYQMVNKRFEELFNVKESLLKGKTDHAVFPKAMADAFRDNDQTVIHTKKPLQIEEEAPHPKSDETHTYISAKFPITDNRNRITAVGGISTDITQQKQLEKAESEFVSLASHQLRTPLSTMRWTLDLLLERTEKFSETQKRLLRSAESATLNLVHIVETMLIASRITANTLAMQKKQIDVDVLLGTIVNEYTSIADEKHITIDLKTDSTLTTHGDAAMLREIIANIISNAVQYSQQGSTVSVSAKRKKDTVVITVTDAGIGIPKKEQKRLFTKFFRASNAMKFQPSGTGLGLYVVRSLVKILGGSITFRSTEGKGTTFTITLPASQSSDA